MDDIRLIGIAKWRFIPNEPRHNTWHNALYDSSKVNAIDLDYVGLKKTFRNDWVNQILPDSILKQFPYINPFTFFRVQRRIKSEGTKLTVVYIFEGTIFWIFFLLCVKYTVANCSVVCNLFSSTRYDKKFFTENRIKPLYWWLFSLVKKINPKDLHITFDTQLMADRATMISGYHFKKFPVPASFALRNEFEFAPKEHYRVLINIRGFKNENLHNLLQLSCKSCTFVFPRGSLGSESLKTEFGAFSNAEFDEKVIPVVDWEPYIDSFDYMIFLYTPDVFPATNISGRILDATVRRVPVCVPSQLSECAEIAERWGRANVFDLDSPEDLNKLFNHPAFTPSIYISEPPFTPRRALTDLKGFAVRKTNSQVPISPLNYGFVFLILTLHTLISITLNIAFNFFVRLRNFLNQFKPFPPKYFLKLKNRLN